MVPKIHSTGGHSFKGCMNYLLHGQELPAGERDQAVQDDPRVAWTLTGNLGTQDPATASRVMAATAMNSERLKTQAGVSTRGKPTTKGDVMHYTLSWEKDEIKNLSKEEMQAAAIASLKKLGQDTTKGKRVPKDGGRRQFADEHQFVLVHHDDKEHKHVHVVVNMTHPKTGRRLPTSNDKRKLSSWARAYQKKHGNEHLCPAREENHKAIAREKKKNKEDRVFIKGEADLNRKDWDLQEDVQNNRVKEALQKKYRSQAAAIAKAGREQKARHGKEWVSLEGDHKKRQESFFKESSKSFQDAKREIVAGSNQKIKQLAADRDADTREFAIKEKTFQGRLQNTWAAIKQKGWSILNTQEDRTLFSTVFRTIYNLHSNPNSRFRPIQDKHDKIEVEHHKKVDARIAEAKKSQNARRSEKLQAGRQRYQQRREELIGKQHQDNEKMKARWKQYGTERRTAWKLLRDRYPLKPGEQQPQKEKTDPAHLLPKEGSEKAAHNIDQHYQKIAENLKQEASAKTKKSQGKNEGRQR